VTVRGNRQSAIFVDDLDRHAFLDRLETVTARTCWTVLDYCLMTNHAHLLVECRVERLSKAMHLLSGWYAQRFNKRNEIYGHHFQGRFSSEPAQRDGHLLEIVRYVALNPVRAGLCTRPQEWQWSGYGALIGRRRAAPFLNVKEALALFGKSRNIAIERLRDFVEDGGVAPRPLSK
jgi:REP element-mobilizing transposase RayT